MGKIGSKKVVTVLDIPFILKKSKKVYLAECLDLNIVTQGMTLKATKKNIKEAINLHLKSASELGILDEELEKLGVVRKDNKFEVSKTQIQIGHIPIEIPS